MKFKPKMGKRLSYLYNLIPSDGDAFYDLCCDHGQIALNVLKFKNYKYVVANDQVPSIIESLSKYIGTYIPQELRSKITVELKSAAEIKPKQDAVFLIAGVGGDTALQIVEAILNSTEFKAEFIISAHKNLIKLRAALNQFGCNFMEEYLIEDNNKFYEIIRVNNSKPVEAIPEFGDSVWKNFTCSQTYLAQTLSYLEKSHNKGIIIKYLHKYIIL